MKKIICFFLFLLTTFAYGHVNTKQDVFGYDLTQYDCIHPDVWNLLAPYFLPEDHPAKPFLDSLTKKNRITYDVKTLRNAGFVSNFKLGVSSRNIVATHPDILGFVFKIYLDITRIKKKEHDLWLRRLIGAELIRKYIQENAFDMFVVPKKWVYPLPDNPKVKQRIQKNFILVAEEIPIYTKEINDIYWKERMTFEILDGLHQIATDLGLWDSIVSDNAPFTKQGKIAFIDTEHFHVKMDFSRILPWLSFEMQRYWKGKGVQYKYEKKVEVASE